MIFIKYLHSPCKTFTYKKTVFTESSFKLILKIEKITLLNVINSPKGFAIIYIY